MEFHFQVILYKSEKFIEKHLGGISNLDRDKDDKVFIHFREQTTNDFSDQIKSVKSKIDIFSKKYPDIHITYTTGENLGFGNGHNAIYEENKTEYGEDFILLNNDTILFFDFLSKLKFYKLKLKEKRVNWGMLEALQFPQEHPKVYDAETLETKWASCACVVVNKTAFEKVGHFDKNIFMYGEDVDLSVRMKLAGYKLITCPNLKFVHITQSFDTKKDPKFEFNYSQAANLYLRYKFGNSKQVSEFRERLEEHPQFTHEIIKIYEGLKSNLQPEERVYVKDFLYSDGDFTQFRWFI